MSALHDIGFDSWETKRALGKEIPTSDDTYLRGLSRKVTEKFPQAYENIKLTGFANHNHTRIEDLEAKIQRLEIAQEQLILQNEAMQRMIALSIPKENMKKLCLKPRKTFPMSPLRNLSC